MLKGSLLPQSVLHNEMITLFREKGGTSWFTFIYFVLN